MASIIRYNTWPSSASPIFRLHREMNELFNSALETPDTEQSSEFSASLFNPSLDVDRDDEKYELTLELPGVKLDDVDIQVREDQLIVSGSKRQVSKSESNQPQRTERRYGRFHRVLSLPTDADDDNISASFQDGVLTISIPRSVEKVEQGGRRIEIAGADGGGSPRLNHDSKDSSSDTDQGTGVAADAAA